MQSTSVKFLRTATTVAVVLVLVTFAQSDTTSSKASTYSPYSSPYSSLMYSPYSSMLSSMYSQYSPMMASSMMMPYYSSSYPYGQTLGSSAYGGAPSSASYHPSQYMSMSASYPHSSYAPIPYMPYSGYSPVSTYYG